MFAPPSTFTLVFHTVTTALFDDCSLMSACSWLEENTPYYYSLAVEKVGPVIEEGWEKTKLAAAFVGTHTSQLVEWIKENTPLFIEWVSAYIRHLP